MGSIQCDSKAILQTKLTQMVHSQTQGFLISMLFERKIGGYCNQLRLLRRLLKS